MLYFWGSQYLGPNNFWGLWHLLDDWVPLPSLVEQKFVDLDPAIFQWSSKELDKGCIENEANDGATMAWKRQRHHCRLLSFSVYDGTLPLYMLSSYTWWQALCYAAWLNRKIMTLAWTRAPTTISVWRMLLLYMLSSYTLPLCIIEAACTTVHYLRRH